MSYAKITGTGSYLPEKILTNKDMEDIVDTSDEWIRERTGIEQRHIAPDGIYTGDLAEKAARKAIEAAGIDKNDIDLIIVATTTPDLVFPSTACIVQKKLGIHGCAAFDVQAVCTGFLYALGVADRFFKGGDTKCALIIGAETLSRVLDWSDRSTCVLFGDGAGAVVLQASDEPGILSSHMHADGSYEHLLMVNYGVSTGMDRMLGEAGGIVMKGNEVFKMAVNTLGRIVDETLEHNNLQKEDIDWLVPHQANLRIINATAKKLKLDKDHVVVTVNKHGNTSAASVPLALDTAVRDGRIKRGEMLLLEAFGGGFTWGSALIRY